MAQNKHLIRESEKRRLSALIGCSHSHIPAERQGSTLINYFMHNNENILARLVTRSCWFDVVVVVDIGTRKE